MIRGVNGLWFVSNYDSYLAKTSALITGHGGIVSKASTSNSCLSLPIISSQHLANRERLNSPDVIPRSPFLAGVAGVLLQRAARELATAVATLRGQLAHCLLDGQVPRHERARDLDATVGARGGLVAKTGVRQKVGEAPGMR